jgi:hypothetical protein
MPIAMHEPITARGTVQRGLRASSPNGAAASNPMKARIENTIPLKMPLKVPASALVGSKIPPGMPFERIIQTARAKKTPISKMPSATPAFVESRTSR